jgi:hypothetical protein
VNIRPSIMNPAIGSEPTEFDRAGALIAFQRLPGNRTPDIDASSTPPFTTKGAAGPTGTARWSKPYNLQFTIRHSQSD